ncbi:MAG: hypothetical protein PHY09_11285 [Desulfuromonadaceae bacterium]|nr:hypothetical protein [Desulfuromonadaceae bacterium]MDD5106128.1 hypothetical protein [Desulfuromonadaceae bacterium]
MRNRKISFVMLAAFALAALLNGCGSDSKDSREGSTGSVATVGEGTCTASACHATGVDHTSGTGIYSDYLTASHNPINSAHATGCQGCHGGGSQHHGKGTFEWPNPLAGDRCIQCHIPAYANGQDLTALFAVAKTEGFVAKCAPCHTKNGNQSVHAAQGPVTEDCVACHSVAAPQHGAGLVNDNNGVRAITGEFAKWSHHVTGVTLNSAHCAACHLEGTVVNGAVVIDTTKHMADNKTHLRNADTDADMQWDPAAPNHTTMDNFCMTCHDADGATSTTSKSIQYYINTKGINAAGKTASATNPFGDTISNRYDKMLRPAVVDVSGQFDTGNASHHAVKGKRYTGRTVAAGARQIAGVAAFSANSSATLPGKRSTMHDNNNSLTGLPNANLDAALAKTVLQGSAFNQLYVPLENAGGETNVAQSLDGRTGSLPLGDDSTLHCGDCHTVGQYKVGSATNMDGTATTVAIGAHGSQNEYMLRNTSGTDARHVQNTYTISAAKVVTNINSTDNLLICFNCHAFTKYGSAFQQNAGQSHAGEYAYGGRCNGSGNTLSFNGYTTGTNTSSYVSGVNKFINRLEGEPQYLLTGENAPDMNAIFGIQCANCHNSGLDNGYGGIHGSKVNTYTDGMGNTTKHERFLPGLGNVMYVPGTNGGITGGTEITVNSKTFMTGGVNNDTNWEQQAGNAAGSVGAGCYTLGNFTEIDGTVQKATNATWPAASTGIKGLSVDGGATTPDAVGTWGGCYDHNAAQGGGTSMNKQIIRPVTY